MPDAYDRVLDPNADIPPDQIVKILARLVGRTPESYFTPPDGVDEKFFIRVKARKTTSVVGQSDSSMGR